MKETVQTHSNNHGLVSFDTKLEGTYTHDHSHHILTTPKFITSSSSIPNTIVSYSSNFSFSIKMVFLTLEK